MPRLVYIALNDRSYPILCDPGDLNLRVYDFCVIEGAQGDEETGYVHAFGHFCPKQKEHRVLPRVLRQADPKDVRAWHFLKRREIEAVAVCKDKVTQHKLDMRISWVKFDDRQRKVIFYFTADKRVDFRELVKDLAATFRARIELWQIGVRDETRQMGGVGICGRDLCCCSWLKEFMPVSIRYAKIQDISFSPAKLSGVCGRLRCCLAYEQSQYAELSRNAPPIGATIVSADFGEARVVDRNLLTGVLHIVDEKGQNRVISFNQVKQVKDAPDAGSRKPSWTFSEDEAEAAQLASMAEAEEDAVPDVVYRVGSNGTDRTLADRPKSETDSRDPQKEEKSPESGSPRDSEDRKSRRRRRGGRGQDKPRTGDAQNTASGGESFRNNRNAQRPAASGDASSRSRDRSRRDERRSRQGKPPSPDRNSSHS